MHPELFRIPFVGRPISSFGVTMMLGVLCALYLAKLLARRTGIQPHYMENVAFIAIIFGVIGARLSHVLENLREYTDREDGFVTNLIQAINITSGGLTFYGGFVLAAIACIIYAIRNRIPLRHGMDIIAPCLMVGLAFGRIGCLLNGCCYGAKCDVPWAITFPYGSYAEIDHARTTRLELPPELIKQEERKRQDGRTEVVEIPLTMQEAAQNPKAAAVASRFRSAPVHPAQIYSTLMAFLLAGLLVANLTLPHNEGHVFMLMLMLEGSARFVLELLRSEPPVAFGMSFSMIVSLLLVSVGIIGWHAFKAFPQPRNAGALPLTPSLA